MKKIKISEATHEQIVAAVKRNPQHLGFDLNYDLYDVHVEDYYEYLELQCINNNGKIEEGREFLYDFEIEVE